MSSLAAHEPGAAPASAGSWLLLYEELLAGIVHAMNNAVTVLGISLELVTPLDMTGDVAGLRRELTQLEKLIGLTATLSNRSERAEALELRAVLDIAVAVHALNGATRAVQCAVLVNGVISPVRVPRAALLRVLLLMIDSAKRVQDSVAAPVTMDVSGDPDRVLVQARVGDALSADAHAYATSCGGTLTIQDGHAVFELPSLQHLRRRDQQSA